MRMTVCITYKYQNKWFQESPLSFRFYFHTHIFSAVYLHPCYFHLHTWRYLVVDMCINQFIWSLVALSVG